MAEDLLASLTPTIRTLFSELVTIRPIDPLQFTAAFFAQRHRIRSLHGIPDDGLPMMSMMTADSLTADSLTADSLTADSSFEMKLENILFRLNQTKNNQKLLKKSSAFAFNLLTPKRYFVDSGPSFFGVKRDDFISIVKKLIQNAPIPIRGLLEKELGTKEVIGLNLFCHGIELCYKLQGLFVG